MADLYIAPVSASPIEMLFPPQRQAQLDATKSENHRRQRYTVWKLLEYALQKSLGLDLQQLQLTLDDRGRWSCRECFFSLAHTDGAVAVAVSRQPVGVDLERLGRSLHPSLPKKILTATELAEYSALEPPQQQTYLLQKWCAKESIFKWQEAAGNGMPQVILGTAEGYCYAVATHGEQLTIYKEEPSWN